MASIAEKSYTAALVEAFQNFDQEALNWLQRGREELLPEALQDSMYPKSKSRYRFPKAARDEVIRHVFEASFEKKPDLLTEKAEAARGRSFYPLWKRVCLIHTPRLVSSTLGNPLIRGAITVTVVGLQCFLGYRAYQTTIHFVEARAAPFIINNAPLKIIQIFNRVMDAINWTFENSVKVVLCVVTAKTIVLLGPEIPYISEMVRRINIVGIALAFYLAPQNIFGFLIETSFDAGAFAWNGSEEASLFFRNLAERGEAERFQICREEAYQLWLQLNSPV